MSVDLPTLGNPTSATSASSFSSRRSQCSSPTSPCSAKPGARRRFDRNRALPRPPRPPSAASQRSPARTRSASTTPSWFRTVVPSGTGTSRSLPRRPCFRLPCPCTPLPAARCGWSLNAISEATLRSTTSHTPPPSPPSPPSGPPLGTCASRRKLTAPAPPSPPLTWRPHSSTNCDTPPGYGGVSLCPSADQLWEAVHAEVERGVLVGKAIWQHPRREDEDEYLTNTLVVVRVLVVVGIVRFPLIERVPEAWIEVVVRARGLDDEPLDVDRPEELETALLAPARR